MIKAVFFDVGGVLIHDDAVGILKRQSLRLGIPYHRLREDMRPDRILLMKGVITRREYLKRLAQKFHVPTVRIRDLRMLFHPYRYIRGSWAVAKRLRKRGYIVGVITNVVPPLPFGPTVRLFPLFRPIIRSWQVKSIKPEERIFNIARRRAGVRFPQMAFCDDRSRNIRAAKRLGIKAFVYKNPAQLVSSLRRLGIRV